MKISEGIFFQIMYNKDKNLYTINDPGNGYGTFIQLQREYYIKESSLINIGDSYLVFSYLPPKQSEFISDSKILKIGSDINYHSILYVNVICKDFQFDLVQMFPSDDSIIKVGRDHECQLCLQDQMLSRVHCLIKYYSGKGWVIVDGGVRGNKSTNGTWMFTSEKTEIWDGMIFKSNSNLMSCHYKRNINF